MDFSLEMHYEFAFSMKDTCDAALEFGKDNALTVYVPYFVTLGQNCIVKRKKNPDNSQFYCYGLK